MVQASGSREWVARVPVARALSALAPAVRVPACRVLVVRALEYRRAFAAYLRPSRVPATLLRPARVSFALLRPSRASAAPMRPLRVLLRTCDHSGCLPEGALLLGRAVGWAVRVPVSRASAVGCRWLGRQWLGHRWSGCRRPECQRFGCRQPGRQWSRCRGPRCRSSVRCWSGCRWSGCWWSGCRGYLLCSCDHRGCLPSVHMCVRVLSSRWWLDAGRLPRLRKWRPAFLPSPVGGPGVGGPCSGYR